MRDGLPSEVFEARLRVASTRVEPLELFIHAWGTQLGPPLIYDSGKGHSGFRYAKPTAHHFCLLKLVRAISALNAMVVLSRGGFTQENAVLVRTIVECTTLVEFVIHGMNKDGAFSVEAQELIDTFFADFARNDVTDYKKSKLRQGAVHAKIGAEQDRLIATTESAGVFRGVESERLYSRIYLTFSGYVHCKYPETMDLCGGDISAPHFHLNGMRGTPKDHELVGLLETYVDAVELSVRLATVKLSLFDVIASEPALLAWHKTVSATRWPE